MPGEGDVHTARRQQHRAERKGAVVREALKGGKLGMVGWMGWGGGRECVRGSVQPCSTHTAPQPPGHPHAATPHAAHAPPPFPNTRLQGFSAGGFLYPYHLGVLWELTELRVRAGLRSCCSSFALQRSGGPSTHAPIAATSEQQSQ